MITKVQYLPVLLIAIDMVAGIVYASAGDKMRAGYWVCAAGITFFATFGQ